MRGTEQHLEQVLQHLERGGWQWCPEKVELEAALGKVAASDVVATIDSPPFANSQMDGYALGADQLAGGQFEVVATIAAGADPSALNPTGVGGQRIAAVMTGARLPAGCRAVVPVEACEPPTFEQVDADPTRKVRIPATADGRFLRARGSDAPAGSVILRKGQVLDALAIGALAAQQVSTISVYRAPRVLICTGGDETGSAGPLTVPDVNGPLLRELCATWGIDVAGHIHTSDDVAELRAKLSGALGRTDVDCIVTSGGISHGRFEVFRQLLTGSGAWFGHVAQQPGGPQGLASFNGKPVICLPGNPISTAVSFRLFVAPALSPYFAGTTAGVPARQLMGALPARLTQSVAGLPDGRDQFLRARAGVDTTGQLAVKPVGHSGSHFLLQAVGANCLLRVPAGANLEDGDKVVIYPLEPTRIETASLPSARAEANSRHADALSEGGAAGGGPARPTTGHAPSSRSPSAHRGRREALVVVVSTRLALNEPGYVDRTGPFLSDWLTKEGFNVRRQVVADENIERYFAELARNRNALPRVIITTGGTGLSKDDRTVEAVGVVLERELPGVVQAIFAKGLSSTPLAAASRMVAGTIANTFLITLPGSMGAVHDGVSVLSEIIHPISDMLEGTHRHD